MNDIASMTDLSCVKPDSGETDVIELVHIAKRFGCGHVSVLRHFIPLAGRLLKDRPDIGITGNVSFPSGMDSTAMKVAQAGEMLEEGCDELDMVINLELLRSQRYEETEKDVRAVVRAAGSAPVKVIIEAPLLDRTELEKACEICIRAGAAFIKTGTGRTPKATTTEDIRLIRSITGDRIKIKASGGIRDLGTLAEMYRRGAVRFGINMVSGRDILEKCAAAGEKVEIPNEIIV